MKKSVLVIMGVTLGVMGLFSAFATPSMGLGMRPGKVIHSGDVELDPRQIHVIDGDTFQHNGHVYDLAFIDAPEIGQACNQKDRMWHCGLDAAYNLRKIFELETGPMTCSIKSRLGVSIADCVTGTIDLSEHLVMEGFVVARQDAPRHYAMAEEKARKAGLGIWRGAFITPARWREGARLPKEHRHDPSAPLLKDLPWHLSEGRLYYDPEEQHLSCIVKGKALDDGRRVYFTPLDEGYATIPIRADKGDTVFCGDEDARAQGFRHVGEFSAKTGTAE